MVTDTVTLSKRTIARRREIPLTFSMASGVIDKAGSGFSPPIVKKVDVVDDVLSVVRLLETWRAETVTTSTTANNIK